MSKSARFATLPEPPYYAAVFSSQRSSENEGYDTMSELMVKRAFEHFGCLGAESTRDAAGFGITVSYWKSEDDIRTWYQDAKHAVAQQLGKEKFYTHYALRVAKVERAYEKQENK